MAGPGGDEVGRVSIRVVPDTDGFRRALQSAVDAAEAGLKVTIPVDFDVDTDGLLGELAALESSHITIPVDIGDGSEIERLRTRLQALDNSQVTIPVDLDLRDEARINAVLQRLNRRTINITARLHGVNQAIARLTALDAIVRRLDGRRINIGIDVDAGAAIAQVAAIETALTGIRASLGTLGRAGGGAFGPGSRLVGGAAQLALLLLQAGAAALALSVAGAAVTAAWGAVSTAILTIPPAMLLLAAPIAAIATGLDGIKAAAKTIKPEFDAMQAAVSKTFQAGMIPIFRQLVSIFPQLTAGMQGTAAALIAIAQRLTEMVTSAAGIQRIEQMFVNVNRALTEMAPGIAAVVDSFLILGAQKSIFDALTRAVNTFGQSFRSMVIDVIADGTLDRAMQGLGESLAALSRGFASLVENGLRVFAAAAPGVNKFLDSLTNFFNRFNWDSLGSSVGRVFEGLSETLDGIDTQTIRDIEQAFSDLGDLFNDPKFQGQLQDMVAAIPEAIGLVKDLSKAFGEAGSDIAKAVEAYDKVKTAVTDVNTGIKDLTGGLDLLKTAWNALPFNALPNFISDLMDFFSDDEAEKKAEESGKGIAEGFQRGLDGLEPQFGGSIDDGWLPDIGKWLKDLFSPEDTDVDTEIDDLKTRINDGLQSISEIAQQAMDRVRATVQIGFAQLPPLAALGMVGVQLAFTNGWLAVQAVTSLGMNTLANTMTLGFTLLQTIVANGMLLLQTAFTTGWTLIQLAVDTGLLLMRTSITEAFVQMQTDAINGMLLFTAAILAGFALVVPAVTLGMAQIVLAVQIGFQQIVAAVQTGMQQVSEAFRLNWSLAVAATQAAMAQMVAAVLAGTSQMVSAMQAGMDQMTSAVQAGGDQMAAAMESAMSRMVSAVQAGMDQLVSAVQAGVDDALGQLRAAEGLFYEAGANMGQALADGLRSKVNAVRSAAGELAAAAAAATRAAAGIRSPSRVFIAFGEYMGAGLAIGMRHSESEVERAARSLASTVIDEASRIKDAFAGDQWAADLDARMSAELAQHDVDPAESATASTARVQVVQNFNVPSAERASDKAAHNMRRLGAMGLFGG